MLLSDMSLGASATCKPATAIAHDLVEIFGLGGPSIGVARYRAHQDDRATVDGPIYPKARRKPWTAPSTRSSSSNGSGPCRS